MDILFKKIAIGTIAIVAGSGMGASFGKYFRQQQQSQLLPISNTSPLSMPLPPILARSIHELQNFFI